MSRVPVWWSTMPTTMNSAALNDARGRAGGRTPAAVAAGVPDAEQHHQEAELADRAVGEQQLEVVLAQRAQAAGHHRDERPTVRTSGRQTPRRRTPGANRATRYTPAFTIVAECR